MIPWEVHERLEEEQGGAGWSLDPVDEARVFHGRGYHFLPADFGRDLVGAGDHRGAAVVRSEVGEVGQRLDERVVVESGLADEAVAVGDAAVEPVALVGGARPAHVGVRLLEAHRAAGDLLGRGDDPGIGDVVEEAGSEVGQVVDAEVLLARGRQVAVGSGKFAGRAVLRLHPADGVEQLPHPFPGEELLQNDVPVDLEVHPLCRGQDRERRTAAVFASGVRVAHLTEYRFG